jgi:hypothetical protein
VIRTYLEEDAVAVGALLDSAWPDDATLASISAIHGPDLDSEDRWRRTLVFVHHEDIVGAGTLLASARHPWGMGALCSPASERTTPQALGASVSIEADDADAHLSQILDELPAEMEPTLLLLSTDA